MQTQQMAQRTEELPLALTSPLEAFYKLEKESAARTAFVQPHADASVTEYTWQRVADEVRRMAAYLQALNLPEHSNIALMSNNCVHWIMADLAIWMAGHVSVPLYPVLNQQTIAYILQHCEAKALFVGKLNNWEAMQAGVPADLPCITFPSSPESARSQYIGWEKILADNEPLGGNPLPQLDELATIIYTSGTTGKPKGVMHSFRGIASVGVLGIDMYAVHSSDRVLSYLPLAHCAERAIVEGALLYNGFTVYFSHSLATFAADLRRARPTILFGVPRIWSKLQQRVFEQVPPEKLERLLHLPLVSRFVRHKILKAMGLDALRFGISGAAPMSTDLMAWYKRMGLEILEAYGMSENFAYSHFTAPGDMKVGYVGKTSPRVDCRIADSGEILVRSPSNMLGYYKEPEKTREALDEDGWLHTGDVGAIDAAGRLRITGRIKEIFKTSKGKYVVPAPIENRLLANPYIEQICVTGASLPQPLGVVVLSDAARQQLQDAKFKISLEKQLELLLEETIKQFEKHESLQCLAIVAEQWNVENNFMTPTLKIKRNEIDSFYAGKFETWFNSGARVIWEL